MENTKYNITIANLIAKSTGGSISDEETAYLKDWLDISEANRLLYHRLSDNLPLEINKELENDSKDLLWSKIDERIKKDSRSILFLRLQIAVSIFIILAVGCFFVFAKPFSTVDVEILVAKISPQQAIIINSNGDSFVLNSDIKFTEKNANIDSQNDGELEYKSKKIESGAELEYNTVIIPKGGFLKLKLADGSNVWLNSNSKLKYPVSFIGDDRHVFLEGEAFFEVNEDKDKAFIVTASSLDVRVYGTSFNVFAYNDSQQLVATLVEGSVKLKNKRGVDKFIKPNEQFSLDKRSGDFMIENVDTRIYTAWVNGRFAFHREKLSSIMSRLARIYDIDVNYKSVDLKDIRFSGEVTVYEDIKDIFKMLEVTQKVKFVRNKNIVVVEKY